jgi:hypothetical protein
VGLVFNPAIPPSMLGDLMGVSAPVPHGVAGVDVESFKALFAYIPKRVDDVRLRMERERETSDAGSGGFSTWRESACSVAVDSEA